MIMKIETVWILGLRTEVSVSVEISVSGCEISVSGWWLRKVQSLWEERFEGRLFNRGNAPLHPNNMSPATTEPRGNNWKDYKEFYLKAQAIIWLWLSHMCWFAQQRTVHEPTTHRNTKRIHMQITNKSVTCTLLTRRIVCKQTHPICTKFFTYSYSKGTLSAAHAHTYIHKYMHTCIHTSIHPSINTRLHTNIHTYIHTYMHAYVHACIHRSIWMYIYI